MALSDKAAHGKDVGKIADLQHRHFATIATIISRYNDADASRFENVADRDKIAEHFADNLARTNPKFDRERFLRACKP